MKISELSDNQKVKLVNNRWLSSDDIWTEIKRITDQNTRIYDNDPEYLKNIPRKRAKVRANRVFVNTESVINSLISNPPQPNFIATRDTSEAQSISTTLESYFSLQYEQRDVKETLRKGLRNLYFSRLIVLKPFWNSAINDFDVKSIDPNKVRFAKYAIDEVSSEFAIEEIEDSLSAVIARFPEKKKQLLDGNGVGDEADLLVNDPKIKYKEAWVRDRVLFVWNNTLLDDIPNPYWDWDGLMITPEEAERLDGQEGLTGEARRTFLAQIKTSQDDRKLEIEGQEGISYEAYYYNHFDAPRKPYIFATVFNNEEKPIGRTDMISQAAPLQESVDRTKQAITYNAEMMNGIVKVDADVMDKADAQKLAFEAQGVIWGKGVVNGVQRETGVPLPNFIVEDMRDSREEIDNIMAASSAFRGEREGTETKAGRLALIQQSQLRLNELTQVLDYINYELFNWWFQLAKVRYTEYHYAKTLGRDAATEILELIQDDFEDGTEVRIVPGKNLPNDNQFEFDRAQSDVDRGIISPIDYLEFAGYNNPKQVAKNAEMYKINPIEAVGITPEEMAAIAPPPSPEEVMANGDAPASIPQMPGPEMATPTSPELLPSYIQ